MSNDIFLEVTNCFKAAIESSNKHLSGEDMEASGEDFACIIQNYNNLLNHHDLSCKAVDKVVSSLNFTDGSLDDFDATKMFKEELKHLQCSQKEPKNQCEELEKLLSRDNQINSSNEFSEVEVVRSVQEVKLDPFTLKPIEVLAKSIKCNHFFEYKTIKRMFGHLKGKKQELKCPHVGCIALLKMQDIEKI